MAFSNITDKTTMVFHGFPMGFYWLKPPLVGSFRCANQVFTETWVNQSMDRACTMINSERVILRCGSGRIMYNI